MSEMDTLTPYIINPKELSEYEDDNFENLGNEIVSIYLVKKNDHIYVKKDFDINEKDDEEEEDKTESHEESENYNSSDSKNPLKYFKREVRHLYDVQIEGYPFL